MLDQDDAVSVLIEAIPSLPCRVRLPDSWRDEASHHRCVAVPDELRRFIRREFRTCAALEYRQTLPAMSRAPGWHRVYTLNVARGGVSFYHSEELFPRERMRLVLLDGCERVIEVARCRRIQDQCHEVGARFVAAMDAASGSEPLLN